MKCATNMEIKNGYQPRHVRRLMVHKYFDWQIKIYTILMENDEIETKVLDVILANVPQLLAKHNKHKVNHYNLATMIVHKGIDACFVIINWWVNDNMLQHHVYAIDENDQITEFANNEIITCIWEMAVLWHERNAWIKYILTNPTQADMDAYVNDFIEGKV